MSRRWRRLWHELRRLARDRRGIAAVEFALVMPLLIGFCLGTFEVGRYVLVQMKLDQLATTVADLGTRDRTLTEVTVTDILAAAEHIMSPFQLGADGVVVMSGVALDGATARVVWQRRGAGGLNAPSGVGTVGGIANLPGEVAVRDGQGLVVAEVVYIYRRTLLGFLPDRELRRQSYFRPRLGALSTPS